MAAVLLLLASCTSTEEQEEVQGPPEAPEPEETVAVVPGEEESSPELILPHPTGRTDICVRRRCEQTSQHPSRVENNFHVFYS